MTEAKEIFEIGDEVSWTSNAKRKVGTIISIVPVGEKPISTIGGDVLEAHKTPDFDAMTKKAVEVCVVSVPSGSMLKPSLYLPAMSLLKKVKAAKKRTPDLPGMPDPGPLAKALQDFVEQANVIAEEKKVLKEKSTAIMEAMQKDKKESLTVTAAGERYRFQIKATGFKLQMVRVKGEE